MNDTYKIITGMLLSVTCSLGSGNALSQDIPGIVSHPAVANYTLLDAAQYQQIVTASRDKVQQVLEALQPYRQQNPDAQIAFIAQQLTDIPYTESGAMGEGDWQPGALTYHPGAVHVQQNPVYRLDSMDCQTLVQVALGLFYANNLPQFEKTIVHMTYGAAGNPHGEYIHYFNRNNFIDGDWNPINQHQGFLTDATKGVLAPYSAKTSAIISRQQWFANQIHDLGNVRVLAEKNGPAMAQRFQTTYMNLSYPRFQREKVTMGYVPKEKLALLQADGNYQPNEELLAKIPTPAVAEIIRDAKIWRHGGRLVKNTIGTELTVSHLGLLYRQHFQRGELIYQKITCAAVYRREQVCQVTPVTCEKSHCDELMFTHATISHPDGYYWYQQPSGNFVCSSLPPTHSTRYTHCNRVESLPLFAYLTNFQYGHYWYMQDPSLLGVHIEELVNKKRKI
jgi:hypothetical protein